MIDKTNITGIILAGGKSTRMGTDKGFLMLNGKSFMQHSIDALKPVASKLIIVSNNTDYDVFGLNRVNDSIENAGPLAGIYSGLKESRTDYNLVLSCDIPLINSDVLRQLISAVENTSEVIQIESNNRKMPLIALYSKSCKTKFERLLNSGERKLQFAVNQCSVKSISLNKNEAKFTTNVNTKDELKQLKRMQIHIKYFGKISEITEITEEQIEFSGGDVSALLKFLYSKYKNLESNDFKVAQNQELVSENAKLTGQDIALLPPFAGG
ncbi:molybdenum cofactor guanylyltransferase [Algibacter lectus]|uniref:NTP transferase domain-containing protein n=1 Tax=Algibacter lectus TaxID=221126 RepID=UPI0008F367BE|nr:NTP transferase domain-containing protein [Algibacter lectus]SFC43483.1 molybdenum cofactor guanylyltransferase [Algibacter lectus]